jgi:PAS domain S-box-containing protein
VKLRRIIYHNYSIILSSILLLFGLYLTSLFSFLLFHGIAEIFSIVIACGIFMVAWNSRRFLDNHYLLFVGIAYLFVALLDLVHTLAYTGMGVFPGYATNLPTQLWIAARYMESVSLLLALFFIRRRLNTSLTFFGYVAITAFLLSSIFYWKLFPDCFIEGHGLTSFKKASEYLISLILLISTGILIQRREAFDEEVLHLLVGSLLLTIGSELFFTFYVHAYGLANLIGHFFKIISFYLIYRAIIQTGLVRPYDLLFRNLKESEERYRMVVEDIPALICRFLPDGTLTYVNSSYCSYFNTRKKDLIGHNFFRFIPEQDQESVRNQFMSLTKETPMITYEHQVIAPDGTTRWQRWTDRALFDDQGTVVEYQSLGTDITERKRAEEALRESEEKYRSMVEAMKAGVYICSPDLRLTFINPAMITRIGRDAVGELCHKAIYGLDDRCPWCVYERLQEGDQIETVTLNPKDNRYYLVSHLPIVHLDGSVSKMTISRDITELKHVEEELRKARDELEQRVLERTSELAAANEQLALEIEEHRSTVETLRKSEKRFRDLVENSLTSIAIVQDDKIVYQNPEQRRLLRSLPQSIVPLSFETVHPDDIEKVRKTYQSLRSGKVRTAEVDFRFTLPTEKGSNTDMKWVYCRASSIEYRGKDAILVNIVDLTRAKETERLLRIQDKMTSLGHVATGIAHEIRNPLSGINIYLSTLDRMYEHTQGFEKTREILDKIQSASEKIESVIKRVMDFSKPSEPEFALTNINKPIEEAIELASVALRKSGVAITKALAADLPLCNADPHLIEQVILNLITNAAEAMKNLEAEKKIMVSSSAQDGLIRVTVADSGPGVPEKERAKIFDPFFTTKNGSPGIGLSLSHRIITDHGGTMRVSTSKLGGAEFMIEIPIDRSVA